MSRCMDCTSTACGRPCLSRSFSRCDGDRPRTEIQPNRQRIVALRNQ